MALRRRAAEMDGEINRQRYADGNEGVRSVEEWGGFFILSYGAINCWFGGV